MTAREYFDQIRDDVLHVASLERTIEQLENQLGPHGQRLDATGHGGGGADAMAVASYHLGCLRRQLELERERTDRELDRALGVLYGVRGRGGLARARGYADADCVCGYYCQGMSWGEVAGEMVRPDSSDGGQWCRARARRALEYIDRVGLATLMDS